MLKHVKFGPVVQIMVVMAGTGAGALGGMLKAGCLEGNINKFIDTVNNTILAMNAVKPGK